MANQALEAGASVEARHLDRVEDHGVRMWPATSLPTALAGRTARSRVHFKGQAAAVAARLLDEHHLGPGVGGQALALGPGPAVEGVRREDRVGGAADQVADARAGA